MLKKNPQNVENPAGLLELVFLLSFSLRFFFFVCFAITLLTYRISTYFFPSCTSHLLSLPCGVTEL